MGLLEQRIRESTRKPIKRTEKRKSNKLRQGVMRQYICDAWALAKASERANHEGN